MDWKKGWKWWVLIPLGLIAVAALGAASGTHNFGGPENFSGSQAAERPGRPIECGPDRGAKSGQKPETVNRHPPAIFSNPRRQPVCPRSRRSWAAARQGPRPPSSRAAPASPDRREARAVAHRWLVDPRWFDYATTHEEGRPCDASGGRRTPTRHPPSHSASCTSLRSSAEDSPTRSRAIRYDGRGGSGCAAAPPPLLAVCQ